VNDCAEGARESCGGGSGGCGLQPLQQQAADFRPGVLRPPGFHERLYDLGPQAGRLLLADGREGRAQGHLGENLAELVEIGRVEPLEQLPAALVVQVRQEHAEHRLGRHAERFLVAAVAPVGFGCGRADGLLDQHEGVGHEVGPLPGRRLGAGPGPPSVLAGGCPRGRSARWQ
jgi:hypothetical protein